MTTATATAAATASKPTVPPEPTPMLPKRRQALHDAALLMSATEEDAADFAKQGLTMIEGHWVGVREMQHAGGSAWCAVAPFARPANIGDDVWLATLLSLNSNLMLLGDSSVALAGDGSAVLTCALTEADEDPRVLSLRLSIMPRVLASVLDALAGKPIADEEPAPTTEEPAVDPAVMTEAVQELAAAATAPPSLPPQLEQWLRGAMLHMGVAEAIADDVARHCSIDFTDVVVRLQSDVHDVNLIATAELGGAIDAGLCGAVLRFNTQLLVMRRFALGGTPENPQLIGRLPVGDCDSQQLAAWLEQFATLAREWKLGLPLAASDA